MLIGFIMLALIVNILQRLRRGKAWGQIVAETGLQFSKTKTGTYRDRRLSGVYRKRPLVLIESMSEVYRADQRRNLGSNQDIGTEIKIKINIPKGYKMRLNRVVAIGNVTQVTGDAEIDRHFKITSEPNWLAPKVLASSNIRQKLPGLKIGGNIFVHEIVQETELLFRQSERIPDDNYLRFLLDFLSDLADAVEAAAIDVL